MEPQHDRVIGFNERSERHPTDHDGPLTRFQIVTIICCALVSALDGIDTQSIGVAARWRRSISNCRFRQAKRVVGCCASRADQNLDHGADCAAG
jgi:hypothetical protein